MPLIDDVETLALSSTTRRKGEERLAEFHNVKDFGAKGDDNGFGDTGTDDTAAIQAAINWTAGSNRGVIFFPAGNYRVTAPLTFHYVGEHSIIFRGVGLASRIVGSVDGFIFHREQINGVMADDTFEHLCILNKHNSGTSGCIRWGGASGIRVQNCSFYGANGFICGPGVFGINFQNLEITGYGSTQTPGTGIEVNSGGPTLITNCDIFGKEIGVFSGFGGCRIDSCRFEMNNIGVYCWDYGASVEGCSFEANVIAIKGSGRFVACGVLADAFGPRGHLNPIGVSTTGVGTNVITVADVTGLGIGWSSSDNTGVLTDWWGRPTGHFITAINTTTKQVTLSKPIIGTGGVNLPAVQKTGCTVTNGSAVMPVSNTTGIVVGMVVEDIEQILLYRNAPEITPYFLVQSIGPGNQVVLNQPAESSGGGTFNFGTVFHFSPLSTNAYWLRGNNSLISCQAGGYFSDTCLKIDTGANLYARDCLMQNHLYPWSDTERMFKVLWTGGNGHKIRTEHCTFDFAYPFDQLPLVVTATNLEWLSPARGEKFTIKDGHSEAIGSNVTVGGGTTYMEVMWTGTAWRRVA